MSNIHYPFLQLKRFEEIAGAMLDKPNSAFLHFTFIVKGSKILSIGWNNTWASPLRIRNRYIIYPLGGIHSEAASIKKLFDLDDCRKATLVNIRLNNQRQLRNSKPCEVCTNLIYTLGFKKIFFSTESGFEKLEFN